MSSGNKEVLIAVNERAQPEDITALQKYAAQRSGEIARWLTAAKLQGSFFSNPGMHSAYESIADPTVPTDEVAHQVLSGLMVRPGTTFCAVDPGGAAFYQPARAGLTADDTPWIFGFSPGLNDPAQLTFLANAGPGIRWDIIECQVAGDAVLSQDSRQVFNPGTQTFAASLVNKVQSSAFNFRIRRGVQGGGIPDIDPNWCPLAAVHVRTDATSFADSDLFDIRPLTTDRCEFSMRHPAAAPSSAVGTRAVLYEAEMIGELSAGVNGQRLRGYYRSQFGGYWSGGQIRRNGPAPSLATFGSTSATGASFNGFNFEDATVRSGGFGLVADTVIALVAVFPRGYPRWVRYSESALPADSTTRLRIGGRYPQGPRGLLMVLNGADGGGLIRKNGMVSPATVPAHWGETIGAHGHVVGYAAVGSAGNDVYPPNGSSADQKYTWVSSSVTFGGASAPGPDFTLKTNIGSGLAFTVDGVAAPKGAASGFCILDPAQGVPKSAAALLLDFQVVQFLAAGQRVSQTFLFSDMNGFVIPVPFSTDQCVNDSGGNRSQLQEFQVWFPTMPNDNYDAASSPAFSTLEFKFNGSAGGAFTANPLPTVRVKGYQL